MLSRVIPTSSQFSLVIAEKPDAAKRIAQALGSSRTKRINGFEVYEVEQSFDSNKYLVCAAAGHLYGLADPSKNRGIFPVFDVEWFSLDSIATSWSSKFRNRRSSQGFGSSRRIRLISDLARVANKFIHACDLDAEGEVIGYNILKFATPSDLKPVLRAKFSTLTENEIRKAFSNLEAMGDSAPRAGRMRHLLDFLWGVNVSRALTESYRSVSSEYNMFTIGRVQGPALGFVVERECDVNCHVPRPYWEIVCTLRKDEEIFEAYYHERRISNLDQAIKIRDDVSKATTAKVDDVSTLPMSRPPPYPFNLGDLQKEAFRIYRLSPSIILSSAERLYLKAMISYPRTDSQKLPASIGYANILRLLSESKKLGPLTKELLREVGSSPKPRQGPREDPAHPAIYPTGENADSTIDRVDSLVYELVLRRFLANFSSNATLLETKAKFEISGHHFNSAGQKLQDLGWTKYYPYSRPDSGIKLPELISGELIDIVNKKFLQKHTERPQRYSEGSLLAKLESENVGTKATRAETITTLFTRGYLERTSTITPTETGLVLIDAMKKYCPEITSPEMTRHMEKNIESISKGSLAESEFIANTGKAINSVLRELIINKSMVGDELATSSKSQNSGPLSRRRSHSTRTSSNAISIGKCPVCQNGILRAIKSPKTRKRFLGCSNYKTGCRTSAPLPRTGLLKPAGTNCRTCGWPEIDVSFARKNGENKPWRICPNLNCSSKASTR